MTNDKIELPKELKKQKPAVKVGAEILPLEGPRAGQLSLNGGDETWKHVGLAGMLVAAKLGKPTERDGIHRHGSYTRSWAVVNGPVKPGDKVIALEFAHEQGARADKIVGGVYYVTQQRRLGSGGLYVHPDGDKIHLAVTKWAKLESENSRVPAVGDKPARSESNTLKKGDVVRILKPYSEEYGLKPGMLATVAYVGSHGGIDVRLDDKAAGGAHAGGYEFPVVLRKGDRVEVTSAVNSQWAGEGAIEQAAARSANVMMKTGRYAGTRGGFLLSELKPLESKVEEKKPELLPVGTRVIVDYAYCAPSSHGKAGVITEHEDWYGRDDYDTHRYMVKMDSTGQTLHVRDLHAEPKPEPKADFPPGDRVRLKAGAMHYDRLSGKAGTIKWYGGEKFSSVAYPYYVVIDGQKEGPFAAKELELVVDEPKFKVGDKVRAIASFYKMSVPVGTVGTITEVIRRHADDSFSGSYGVTTTGSAFPWTFEEGQLELFTDSPVRKVKVNAVKDIDGDIWISSNKLFGDKLWHWVGNDVGFGAKTFEQLEKDHGPLTAVTE